PSSRSRTIGEKGSRPYASLASIRRGRASMLRAVAGSIATGRSVSGGYASASFQFPADTSLALEARSCAEPSENASSRSRDTQRNAQGIDAAALEEAVADLQQLEEDGILARRPRCWLLEPKRDALAGTDVSRQGSLVRR